MERFQISPLLGKFNSPSKVGVCCLFIYALVTLDRVGRYPIEYCLWFCDLGLLLVAIGLITRSSLLVGAQICALLGFHLAWNVSFWVRFLSGRALGSETDYMFYPRTSLWFNSLSFVSHVFVVPAALIGIWRLGMPRYAWLVQWFQTVLIVGATVAFTRPEDNINWAFRIDILGIAAKNIGYVMYYCVFAVVLPIGLYWPTNYFLCRFSKSRAVRTKAEPKPMTCWQGAVSESTAHLALAAEVTVLLSVAISVAYIARSRYGIPQAAFERRDGIRDAGAPISNKERVSNVTQIRFGEEDERRAASLLEWHGEIPTRWSGADHRQHPDIRAVLREIHIESIPSVPQDVTLVGTRAVVGSAVWGLVVSDDVYLQPIPDLTNGRRFSVHCQIGGRGVSEFINVHTGEPFVEADDNEIVGGGIGALYIVGVLEVSRGVVAARSPLYLIKRTGIRFPEDIWFIARNGAIVPLLSPDIVPMKARIAFQSSPDPAHVPTRVFVSGLLGDRMYALTPKSTKFFGFLEADGTACPGIGWITDRALRYCESGSGRLVEYAVADH